MGEEHDSWLSGLGINITPSDASDSMKSSFQDMVQSGRNVVGDVANAGVDFAKAGVEGTSSKVAYVDAGLLDAMGAHGTAKTIREKAGELEDDAGRDYHAAGGELRKAKDDAFGDGPSSKPYAERQHDSSRMGPECKVVRGKVPGPANHVLCGTHGHILDLGNKTIIAGSLEEYKKTYAKSGGAYGIAGKPAYGKSGGGGERPPQPEYGEDEQQEKYRGGGETPIPASYPGKKGGQKGNYQEPEQPEQPEYHEQGGEDYQEQPPGAYGKGGGQRMRTDCKPVHGKCPGPKNHVLCAEHGHVLDTDSGMIIASSVADYAQRYCGGGKGGGYAKPPTGGYGGGGGGYQPQYGKPKGGGYEPPKPQGAYYGGEEPQYDKPPVQMEQEPTRPLKYPGTEKISDIRITKTEEVD